MLTTSYLMTLQKGLGDSMENMLDHGENIPTVLLTRYFLLHDLIKASKAKEATSCQHKHAQ